MGYAGTALGNDRWDILGEHNNLVIYDLVEGKRKKEIPVKFDEFQLGCAVRTHQNIFLRAVHRKTGAPHLFDLKVEDFIAGRQKIAFGRDTETRDYGYLRFMSPSGRYMLTEATDGEMQDSLQVWRRK